MTNSAVYRKDMDKVLLKELGAVRVDVPGFHEAFFGRVAGLEAAAEAVLAKCALAAPGAEPLLEGGRWSGWPADANQDGVLRWFAVVIERLTALVAESGLLPTRPRWPVARPNKPVRGSTADRRLDVGFANDPYAGPDSHCYWLQILVPGELKSNPTADRRSQAWLDLATYVREVFAAQPSRRFVLGFTLCGSLMRVWEFDRLGALASDLFDIHKQALRFVRAVLGFLHMSEEELGFDPTIMTAASGERYVEIERDGSTERLIIDELILRTPCVAGRATTCWKAHLQGRQERLVIKDSWQYPERDEEGELLCEATAKGVINVARYYHHETVRAWGAVDDVWGNVRRGLHVASGTNCQAESPMPPPLPGAPQTRRGSSIASKKRAPSQASTSVDPPHRKRSGSASSSASDLAIPKLISTAPQLAAASTSHLTTALASGSAPHPASASSQSASGSASHPTSLISRGHALPNRVHRRLVLLDCGRPIYKASSRSALLTALAGCIRGHESLLNAGFLHRDISINNLIINEGRDNKSWPSFIIDLDLAIRLPRDGVSGAQGMTGTRAFMAVGLLLGERHSFMHDLESFFWVLFWICIHYGPDKSHANHEFDEWNYIGMTELARRKKGQVSHDQDFIADSRSNFTPYYQPLTRWVNILRRVVFPNDKRWEREDRGLYTRMADILEEAARDPAVLAEDHVLSEEATGNAW